MTDPDLLQGADASSRSATRDKFIWIFVITLLAVLLSSFGEGAVRALQLNLFRQFDLDQIAASLSFNFLGVDSLTDLVTLLAAFTCSFVIVKQRAHSWVAAGLLIWAACFTLMRLTDSGESFVSARLLGEVGRVVVLVAVFGLLNELVVERQRARFVGLIWLISGLTPVVAIFFEGHPTLPGGRNQPDWDLIALLTAVTFFIAFLFYAIWSWQSASQKMDLSSQNVSVKRMQAFGLHNLALLAFPLAVLCSETISSTWLFWFVEDARARGGATAEGFAEGGAVFALFYTASIFGVLIIAFAGDWMNRLLLLIILSALTSMALLLVFLGSSPADLTSKIYFCLFGFGFGGLKVVSFTLGLQAATPELRARFVGLAFGFAALAGLISPIVGGVLYSSYGAQSTFAFSALVLGVLASISVLIYRKSPGPSAAQFRSLDYQPQSGRA